MSKISLQIQNNLNNVVRVIMDYAIWNLVTYDPIVEDLFKKVAQSFEERNTSHDAITTSNPSVAHTSNQPMQRVSTQLPLANSTRSHKLF